MEQLTDKIFETADGQLAIREFEKWLYDKEELLSRINEPFIFELFDFNYQQKGAQYIFKNLALQFCDEKAYVEWKIKSNLKILINETELVMTEKILYDFYDLMDDYLFLNGLGSKSLEIGWWDLYGSSKSRFSIEIKDLAQVAILRM